MLKGANKSLKNTPKGASNSIAYALGSRYSLFSVDYFLTTFYEKMVMDWTVSVLEKVATGALIHWFRHGDFYWGLRFKVQLFWGIAL